MLTPPPIPLISITAFEHFEYLAVKEKNTDPTAFKHYGISVFLSAAEF